MKRIILLVLHIISLVLLGFGWFLDMMHIDISTNFLIQINLFNENRSVLGTLRSLWNGANYWSFSLIFLFGIVVPVLKSALIFYLLLARTPGNGAYRFVQAVSKWAMADVFAISIFVAFLGANAMDNTRANLEPGFYFFSGYVLLSAALAMLIGKMPESSSIQ